MFQHTSEHLTPSVLGVQSPHLQFSRVDQHLFSNPTSSNNTSLNSRVRAGSRSADRVAAARSPGTRAAGSLIYRIILSICGFPCMYYNSISTCYYDYCIICVYIHIHIYIYICIHIISTYMSIHLARQALALRVVRKLMELSQPQSCTRLVSYSAPTR